MKYLPQIIAITVFTALCVYVMNREFGYRDHKAVDQYNKGRQDGIEWAILKVLDHKMALAPETFQNATNIQGCVFIKVIKSSPMVSLVPNTNADFHLNMSHSLFIGEGIKDWGGNSIFNLEQP